MAFPAPKPPPARAQRDLFQLNSPLIGEVRGERSLMAFPFFALAKSAWMKPLSYEQGLLSIEVRLSAKGVATIYDKEIVLYIASLMAAKIEAGEEVAQYLFFTAHDLFWVTGANHSARPIPGCLRRSSACRERRSAPISRRAGSGRRASSPGSPKRGCITPRRARARNG